MNKVMKYKGFKAKIMEAKRLEGDIEHDLPDGKELPVYPTAAFKQCPEHWMKEDGCFVVPVKPDKGLWFDWRDNDQFNTAVLPTIKGCNPITGMKTEGFKLERYNDTCPKHGTKFLKDRYCDECGYKWPVQNYISSPNIAWWDGFRATDGTVRQFFITADMLRDVASHMIGKENTVPAFGFAFYETKEKKSITHDWVNIFKSVPPIEDPLKPHPFVPYEPFKPYWEWRPQDGPFYGDMFHSTCNTKGIDTSITKLSSKSMDKGVTLDSLQSSVQASFTSEQPVKDEAHIYHMNNKEVAIGAGAKIKQGLQPDPYKAKEWKANPSSVMRIYFVFEDEFNYWKSFGLKDLEGKVDGMLGNIPVG